MTSKIDFSLLLAQADKNTNKAQKLLEEKKQLNQKKKQSINSNKVEYSKEIALDFEKRKEEIRKRNEQEAKELLEKKKQKDAIKNLQTNKITTLSKTKTNQVSKEAVRKYLKLKDDGNISKSSKLSNNATSINGYNTINQGSSKISSQTTYNFNKNTKSYYDQEAIVNTKIVSKHEGNSILKDKSAKNDTLNSLKKTSTTNGLIKKQQISYDQILKMADNCHKESKISTTKNESKSSNDYSNLLYGNSKLKKYEISEKSALETNLKKDSKSVKHIRTRFNKIVDSSKKPKASNQIPITSGQSAWDRIISDMKKKPVQKIKKNISKIEEDIDSDNEENEYDSEMDDFIDDESCEDDGNQKDYKKTIHEIFKYDPKRYKNINLDDVDNMETDYHSQLKEEKISLKLGILEDIEEQKKEYEEERRKFLKQKKREIVTNNKDNKRQKSN